MATTDAVEHARRVAWNKALFETIKATGDVRLGSFALELDGRRRVPPGAVTDGKVRSLADHLVETDPSVLEPVPGVQFSPGRAGSGFFPPKYVVDLGGDRKLTAEIGVPPAGPFRPDTPAADRVAAVVSALDAALAAAVSVSVACGASVNGRAG